MINMIRISYKIASEGILQPGFIFFNGSDPFQMAFELSRDFNRRTNQLENRRMIIQEIKANRYDKCELLHQLSRLMGDRVEQGPYRYNL